MTTPRAVPSKTASFTFKEMAMDFGGDVKKSETMVYCSANEDTSTCSLSCPAGQRPNKVLFASYGRPKNPGNMKTVKGCDHKKTAVPYDWTKYEINPECHSDSSKPSGFTFDLVESQCLGQTACSISPKNEVFGDPCPGNDKWVSIAMRCSDRYMQKDYVMDHEVSKLVTSDAYSFGAWIKPMPVVTSTGAAATKVMTIAAFGTSIMNKETKMNLGVIQYKGTGPKGEAYYYDENILDVKPKYASGKFMELSAGEWAHVFVTIDADNNGVFYVNAQPVQTFTTASRPDKTGSGLFTVGMGYGDNYVPKEFNLGMIDNVAVYNENLSASMVEKVAYWARSAESSLLLHLKFNLNLGAMVPAKVGPDGTASSSTTTVYSNTTGTFTGTSTVHPTYAYTGAPWFPAETLSVKYSLGYAQMAV